MKILIVDDKEENVYFLEALLKGNGYQTVSAVNGAEALEKLRSEGAEMIVSDVLMPVMDGFSLCKEVRADCALKDIPFIFYTATYRDKRDSELASKLGADRYIVKPVEPDVLLKALQEVMQEGKKERTAPDRPVVEEEEEVFKLYSERLVAKLEKKMLDLEESEKRYRDINHSLETLSRCNQILIHTTEEKGLLNDICRIIVDTGGYQSAWVGLTDKDINKHLFLAALAEGKEIGSKIKGSAWTDLEPVRSIAETAIRKKETVLIRDLLANPVYSVLRRETSDCGFASTIAFPLIAGSDVLGVMNIFASASDAFDTEEVRLLKELADDMAFGIMTLRARDSHRQAEQALERSEKMLRLIFEGARDGILGLGVQSKKFVVANETICRMLGYSQDEIVGLGAEDIYPMEAVTFVKDVIARQIKGESELSTGIPVKRKDGTVFFADISSTLLELEGQPCLLGIFRDITERRLMDEQLKKSEADYRDLYDNAPVGYHELDSNGIIVRINQTEAQLLGYSVEDLTGRPYLEIIAPQDRDSVDKILFDKISGTLKLAPTERKYICRNGKALDVLIDDRLITDEQGQVKGIRTTVQDISELKQAEGVRRLLSAAMEQSGEAIIITDEQGAIVYTNPAFEKITGYTQQEALRQNPRLLKSGQQGEDFYRNMWETIAAGQIWRGRLVNRKKDGSLYHEEAAISPVRNDKGRITNFVAVKRDVTLKLELESQLRQAQKMESVGLLAGGVAHDFNNILAAILGFSDLIIKDRSLPENTIKHAMEVEKAALRGAEVTKQLLSFSRKQKFQLQTMNLYSKIDSMIGFLSRAIGPHVTIRCSSEKGLWIVEADETQIQQVLLNLCLNSRDAMPDGGRIEISLSNCAIDSTYTSHHANVEPGDYVLLALSDAGVGMDQETLGRIFEPFFTTKTVGKGTGLGLPVVYGIMKNHNGFINVYSEPGLGTTFKLYFPRSLNALEHKEEEKDSLIGGDETILIVDDEVPILKFTSCLLEKYGYKCLTFNKGVDALECYSRQSAEIDLVILDIIMPGISGTELLEKMKSINPSVRVIMSSGFSMMNEKSLLDRGVVGFLNKPYQLKKLVKSVREILDRKT